MVCSSITSIQLRLGVAATFVIEIPTTIFLLLPSVRIRRIGSWLQIVLQVLIIATGNYNYFNLLTIALCIPCMIDDGMKGKSSDDGRSWQKLSATQTAICAVLFLLISCKMMFRVEQHITEQGKRSMGLKLAMNKNNCNNLVKNAVPIIIIFTLICTLLAGSARLFLTRKDAASILSRLSVLTHTFVCLVCILITAIPLFDLDPSMHSFGFVKQSTLRSIRRQSSVVSHGYGLFRRMTGVGKKYNGTGPPLSVVARPEIVFEAILKDSSGNWTENDWTELNFRWKPGAIDRRPRQVAPHQPRFEWRMWFAALGSIQHNAWLVSFVDKMLAGCPSVIDLLDEPEILFTTKKRIHIVRALLYEYDFTRLDSEWARSIPDAHIIGMENRDGSWWSRNLVREYLPALTSDNESLKQFIQHAGYSTCKEEGERCNSVGRFCHVVYFLRRVFTGRPLFISVMAILSCAIGDASKILRVLKTTGKMKRE